MRPTGATSATGIQQQIETGLDSEDFVVSHQQRASQSSPMMAHSHYQRLQFRRMYRYGLSLLLVGALCNWIGFAQNYFAPVRYLGVGCVIVGAICICIALCRWLTFRSGSSSANQEISCTEPNIHVISVSVQSADPFQQQQTMPTKPPDYETAVGCKPPSYDEAIRITPAPFLHLNPSPATVPLADSAVPVANQTHRSSRPACCAIDCSRCDGVA